MLKYQELARLGNTRPSRFIAGTSFIMFTYFIIGSIFSGVWFLIAMFRNPEALISDDALNLALNPTAFLNLFMGVEEQYLMANLTIYLMILGVFVAVRYIHYRPFKSLITQSPKISISKMMIGIVGYGLLLCAGSLVDYLLYPETYSFSFEPSRFWIMLPVVLIMTPIQTTAEELVFRGYVIQGFGLKVRNAWLLSLISGAIFMLPHLANPEVFASTKMSSIDTTCTILNYFVVGVLLAIVTIKSNSLEIAIGVHAINNLFCFLVVSFPDAALTTNTIFFTSNFDPVMQLVYTLIISVAFYGIVSLFVKIKPQLFYDVQSKQLENVKL